MKLYKHWNGIELHADNNEDKEILLKLLDKLPGEVGIDTSGYETCGCNVITKSEMELPGNEDNNFENITPCSDILMIRIG